MSIFGSSLSDSTAGLRGPGDAIQAGTNTWRSIEKNLEGATSADIPINNARALSSQKTVLAMACRDDVATLNSFIAAAIRPFKLVFTKARMHNGDAPEFLSLQIQSIICTLLQHHYMKPIDLHNWLDPLRGLTQLIDTKIHEYGSACDAYVEEGISKTKLKKAKWSIRLLGRELMKYRDELKDIFTQSIAEGIKAINEKKSKLGNSTQSAKEQLQELFRALPATPETKLMKLVHEYGGVTSCLNNDEFLETLRMNLGDLLGLEGETNQSLKDFAPLRKLLTKPITENIDTLVWNNMEMVRATFELQKYQLAEIESRGDYIITLISDDPGIKFNHRDLQDLWRAMTCKESVPAQKFVLYLYDYYTNYFKVAAGSGLFSNGIGGPTIDIGLSTVGDQWALQYICPHNMQAIVEVLSANGEQEGLITIEEVNAFTKARPDGWTLLGWFAFWAKGWHTTLCIYRDRIYAIIQEMHKNLNALRPDNYNLAAGYLNYGAFFGIEHLLRSTKPPESIKIIPELELLAKEYMDLEETRLKDRLEAIKYEIRDSESVSIVTGQGRIEKFVYPLLFLTLKRHLRVFAYATKHVVSEAEFPCLAKSLDFIFDLVFQRIFDMKRIFRHARIDMDISLDEVSYGMFSLLAKPEDDADRKKSTLFLRSISSEDYWTESKNGCLPIFTADPRLDTVHFEWPKFRLPTPFETVFDLDKPGGFWAGHFSLGGRKDVTYGGLVQVFLEYSLETRPGSHLVERVITGYGICLIGIITFKGRYRVNSGEKVEMDVIMTYPEGEGYLCARLIGTFDPDTQELSGSYKHHNSYPHLTNEVTNWFEASSGTGSDHVFRFQRATGEVYKHRFNDYQQPKNPVQARWCFLRDSLSFYIRQKMWSWQYIKSWGEQRREYMELYGRRHLADLGYALSPAFAQEEPHRLYELELTRSPLHILLYRKLAQCHMDKILDLWCNGCGMKVSMDRHVCLDCTLSHLDDSANICHTCVGMAKAFRFKDQIEHTAEHDLINLHSYLPRHSRNQLFFRVKAFLSRLRENAYCETLEEGETSGEQRASSLLSDGSDGPRDQKGDELVCIICHDRVTSLLWICLTCDQQAILCNDCCEKDVGSGSLQEGHDTSHYLVRVRNEAFEIGTSGKTDSTGIQNDAHQGLADSTVQSQIQRLDALESRLVAIEDRIQEHGDLLRRILHLLEDAHPGVPNGSV